MPELPGANQPNPPPLPGSEPIPQPPVVPENWVPNLVAAMEFTNYLWSNGFLKQAFLYWQAYCKAAGIEE